MDAASTRSFARQDAIFARSTQFFALLVLFTLLAIVGSLIYGAWPTINQVGPKFIVDDAWDPVRSLFGGLAPLWGTICVIVGHAP